jgi:lipopolysaccharide transport system ATP-binding protein
MSSHVKLSGVTLDYPIYSVRAKSLRSSMFNLAIGGRLYKSQSDITQVRALNNVHIQAEEGDRLALVGHNGSGKTTLLKVISGIYEPDAGDVEIGGELTSMISHGAGLDPEVTGLQNIYNLGAMRMMSKKAIDARIDGIVEFSELGGFAKLPLKTYSAGMTARLMFAVATEFPADILVLDEWLGAGDVQFVQKASQRMREFVEKARIVILGTHDSTLVRSVCNKVCELEAGQVTFFGPTEEWLKRREAA